MPTYLPSDRTWGAILRLLALAGIITAMAVFWPRPGPAYASGTAAVSTGGEHTCALTSAGGVKCWGNNSVGQLGDGTTIQRLTAVDVSGLPSGVAAVSAGDDHTCALTTGGGIKCWGYNFYGQLGDGTTTQRTTPVDISSLVSGVAAVAAGGVHTCALTAAAGIKCWGYNFYGQLGDGTTTQRTTPVDVSGLTNGVAAVAAGGEGEGGHTCALTTAGGLKCWGRNVFGKLGDGTTTNRTTPVDVSGLGPKPTPTPAPQAVGGIFRDVSSGVAPLDAEPSSGSAAWLLTGAIAASMAVVALGGTAWWARRKFGREPS